MTKDKVNVRFMRHKRKGLYIHIDDVLDILKNYHSDEVVKVLEELRVEV